MGDMLNGSPAVQNLVERPKSWLTGKKSPIIVSARKQQLHSGAPLSNTPQDTMLSILKEVTVVDEWESVRHLDVVKTANKTARTSTLR